MTNKIEKLEQQKAELERKQKELNAKIRQIKAREANEKRKKSTHYKVLLGAFWLNEITNNPLLDVDRNFPKLQKFINDDKKFAELKNFIQSEIDEKK